MFRVNGMGVRDDIGVTFVKNPLCGKGGPRWQCRKTLNSPPPMDTLNLYLLIEQFFQKN